MHYRMKNSVLPHLHNGTDGGALGWYVVENLVNYCFSQYCCKVKKGNMGVDILLGRVDFRDFPSLDLFFKTNSFHAVSNGKHEIVHRLSNKYNNVKILSFLVNWAFFFWSPSPQMKSRQWNFLLNFSYLYFSRIENTQFHIVYSSSPLSLMTTSCASFNSLTSFSGGRDDNIEISWNKSSGSSSRGKKKERIPIIYHQFVQCHSLLNFFNQNWWCDQKWMENVYYLNK